jgi:hypothetical protein
MSQNELKADLKSDPWNNIAVALFFGFWCGVGWWSVLGNGALSSDSYGLDPGPGLMPKLVLSVLTFGSVTILIKGLFGLWRMGDGMPDPFAIARRAMFPALFAASVLLYIPLMFQVGFIPASLVFSGLWMCVLGLRSKHRGPSAALLQAGAGTIIGVGLVYVMFGRLIGVPLP